MVTAEMRHFTESALNEAKSGVLQLLFIRSLNEQFIKLLIPMCEFQCFTRKSVPAGTENVHVKAVLNEKTTHPLSNRDHAR